MKAKPKIIKFKSFKDITGQLIPFYSNKHFPKNFVFKRIFFLYGKKKYLRADHAHKKCTQIIIPILGKIKVKKYKNNRKKIFNLSPSNKKALLVPVFTWLNIKFFKDNDCLLTICNYKYDKKEYISNFNDFLKTYY